METVNDMFYIDCGVELYRNDFRELEELLKYGDTNTDYGTKFGSDSNLFRYNLTTKKDDSNIDLKFGSIVDFKPDSVNGQIENLTIEKDVYEDGVTNRINISISRNSVRVSISSNDFLWNKHKRLLIEDFFKKKKSKSGEINRWFTTKGSWVVSILVGILFGFWVGFKEPVFGAFAVLIFASFTMLSSPLIRNKVFPNNHIYLKEISKDESQGRKGKENMSKLGKMKLYLTNILIPQMIPSIAASIFITIIVFIYKYFVE